MGEKLGKISFNISNYKNEKFTFGHIGLNIVARHDDNTSYIFTDEAKKYFTPERSTLNAESKYNTLNIAPVTSTSHVNLTKGTLKIFGNEYKLNGNFHNVFAGSGSTEIIGNNLDNILVGGYGSTVINAVSGRNILCNGKADTTLISGSGADMFVIRPAPNKTTIIKNFKTSKFDTNIKQEQISDIINFAAFKHYTLPSQLNFTNKNGSKVIELENNQKIIIDSVEKVFGYNFAFEKNYDFQAAFSPNSMKFNHSISYILYGNDNQTKSPESDYQDDYLSDEFTNLMG